MSSQGPRTSACRRGRRGGGPRASRSARQQRGHLRRFWEVVGRAVAKVRSVCEDIVGIVDRFGVRI